MRTTPLLLLALALAGCGSDANITRLYPEIATAPAALDFGRVIVGEEAVLTLQVVNSGEGPLSVSSIELVDDSYEGVYTVTPPSLELAADDSAGVVVTFEPADFLSYESSLALTSNDPEAQLVAVPLVGMGVDGGPDIELSATALDFDEIELGSTSTQVFTVSNVGDAPLLIDHDSPQDGSGAFSLLSDPRGEAIDVGNSFTVLVQYAPVAEGGDAGSLTLNSNDPDDPQATISFTGNGGDSDDYPVALIDAFGTGNPGETLILDGTGSYDPNGLEPLSYAWSMLEQPPSSASAISNTALSAPYLTLDTSGTYVVALQVTNTGGVASAPAIHTISAEPDDALYVELTWDSEDADFDLHLLSNDAELLFDSPTDCCWCNENPDWGVADDPDDDPQLSADAEGGGGPESILIRQPAEGEYFIRAHYFQDNGAGLSEATVKIYVAGEEVAEFDQELSHNQVWEVGYVRWPQGYVIEEGGQPFASDDRACF